MACEMRLAFNRRLLMSDPQVALTKNALAWRNFSPAVLARQLGQAANHPRVVAKGRVIRPSHSWFNADFVVHRKPELLFTAEVMFRRLNAYVAEKELNLVELAARQMAKTCTCPSQIVRRQFVYARGLGRFLDDFPKHLRRHALAPDPS